MACEIVKRQAVSIDLHFFPWTIPLNSVVHYFLATPQPKMIVGS
ncbi:hypothetical protein SAMN05216332_102132 [Nitrosospira briensis]|nr:hypothetical protein SAMN05216332_102132 [Nitrosospira briensis]